MTLVVEDGTGLSNAESYASVAFAAAYHASRGNSTWDDVDDPEVALRKATDYMEATYRLKWKGYKKVVTQALSWPRTYVDQPDWQGYAGYVDSDSVPTLIAQVCCELALRTVSGDELIPDLSPEDFAKRVKVGSLEVEYAEGGVNSKVYPFVQRKLAPYLQNSGRTMIGRL